MVCIESIKLKISFTISLSNKQYFKPLANLKKKWYCMINCFQSIISNQATFFCFFSLVADVKRKEVISKNNKWDNEYPMKRMSQPVW